MSGTFVVCGVLIQTLRPRYLIRGDLPIAAWGRRGGEAPGGNPSPRANTASSKSRSTVGNEDEYECLERRPCNRVGDVWCSVVVRWRQREGIGGGVGVQRNLLGLEGACWYY